MFDVSLRPIFPAFINHLLERFILQNLVNNTTNLPSARPLSNRAYSILDMRKQLFKRDKSKLGLNMRVLTQVPSCMRLFSPKTRRNTIHISQRRQRSFQIQLTTLRQIRILPVILEVKKGTSTLDLRLNHTRRRDFGDVVFGVAFAEGLKDCAADLEDVSWDCAADDEVALVVESLGEGLVVDDRVAGFEA